MIVVALWATEDTNRAMVAEVVETVGGTLVDLSHVRPEEVVAAAITCGATHLVAHSLVGLLPDEMYEEQKVFSNFGNTTDLFFRSVGIVGIHDTTGGCYQHDEPHREWSSCMRIPLWRDDENVRGALKKALLEEREVGRLAKICAMYGWVEKGVNTIRAHFGLPAFPR